MLLRHVCCVQGEDRDLLFFATERYKFCVLQWDTKGQLHACATVVANLPHRFSSVPPVIVMRAAATAIRGHMSVMWQVTCRPKQAATWQILLGGQLSMARLALWTLTADSLGYKCMMACSRCRSTSADQQGPQFTLPILDGAQIHWLFLLPELQA